MATATTAQRTGWPRRIVEGLGFAFLLYLAGALICAAFRPDHGYGPDEARDIQLTLAKGVTVEIMPSAASLASLRFEHFDLTASGAVLVGSGGQIFDMMSGEALASGANVRSFAITQEALAVVGSDGRLGHFDGQSIQYVAPAPVPEAEMTSSSDGTLLFLHRTGADDSGWTPALVSVAPGRAPQVLTGSFEPVGAVGGDAITTYFAVGNALYQIVAPGRPNLVLILPRQEDAILGIASGSGATYFSTARGIYLVTDDFALPLVLGIGGRLRIHGADLYVLSQAHGRVYRIVLGRRDTGQ